MAEPKPMASLSSGLLARKGDARPAMRRQNLAGFGDPVAAHDDLGWNDMGYDAEPPKRYAGGSAMTRPLDGAIPEVVRQQEELQARVKNPAELLRNVDPTDNPEEYDEDLEDEGPVYGEDRLGDEDAAEEEFYDEDSFEAEEFHAAADHNVGADVGFGSFEDDSVFGGHDDGFAGFAEPETQGFDEHAARYGEDDGEDGDIVPAPAGGPVSPLWTKKKKGQAMPPVRPDYDPEADAGLVQPDDLDGESAGLKAQEYWPETPVPAPAGEPVDEAVWADEDEYEDEVGEEALAEAPASRDPHGVDPRIAYLRDKLNGAGREAPAEPVEPARENYHPPELRVVAANDVEEYFDHVRPAAKAPEPARPAATPDRSAARRISENLQKSSDSRKRAAFTLRVDPERHFKLRIACALRNVSAQQLVTEALDEFLTKLPEVEEMAGRLPRFDKD